MSPQQLCPELEVQRVGDILVVKFTRLPIEEATAVERTGRHLLDLVTTSERPWILLDCANLNQLCSALLGKLIRLCKKTQAAGGELVLYGVRPQLYELFHDIHLERLVTIFTDQNDALVVLGNTLSARKTASSA